MRRQHGGFVHVRPQLLLGFLCYGIKAFVYNAEGLCGERGHSNKHFDMLPLLGQEQGTVLFFMNILYHAVQVQPDHMQVHG